MANGCTMAPFIHLSKLSCPLPGTKEHLDLRAIDLLEPRVTAIIAETVGHGLRRVRRTWHSTLAE